MRFPAGESNRYHPGRMVRSQIGGSPAAPNDKWWLALRWGSLAMTMWLSCSQGSKLLLFTTTISTVAFFALSTLLLGFIGEDSVVLDVVVDLEKKHKKFKNFVNSSLNSNLLKWRRGDEICGYSIPYWYYYSVSLHRKVLHCIVWYCTALRCIV